MTIRFSVNPRCILISLYDVKNLIIQEGRIQTAPVRKTESELVLTKVFAGLGYVGYRKGLLRDTGPEEYDAF